jgi:GDP-L-fucose synthase
MGNKTVLKDKKVLVTGGTGFVGLNLINRLLPLGADVRATIHRKDPVIHDKRIEYIRCDLTKMEDCRRAADGIDYVFMCAANTSGAATIEATPLVHVTPNIVMNSQMLEATYFARVKKFLWLSSTTGYPVSGDKPVTEEEMLNGDPYDKYFFVGWMKRYTEVLCRMYSEKLKNPMTTVVLRPTNIYGEYDDFEFATSHVLPALIRKVVERHDPIEVWGTGEDVRDLIYVDDLIDAMLLAMERIESYNPINIGFGKGYAVKDILQMILEVDGYTGARVKFDPSKPSMIPIRLIDTTKAETILGFKAKTELREGIRRTIDWYRKTHNLRKC